MVRRGAVLAAGGLRVSIPALLEGVRRWEAAGARVGDDDWREAHRLAGAIRAQWPQEVWVRNHASTEGRSRDLLDALLRLGDLEGGAEFTAALVAGGAYSLEDNPALALLFHRLPPARATELLGQVITAHVARRPGACANLLNRCAADGAPAWLHALSIPARLLLQGLPDGQPVSPTPFDYPQVPEPLTAAQLAEAVSALGRIDAALADQAVARCLSWPAVYDPDRLLVPAALALKSAGGEREPPAVKVLREAVLAHLEARIALPLEPPADWARPVAIACKCAHCRALSGFLASPEEPVWHFKANEVERRHVAVSIQSIQCDLDLATNKGGRPFTLICTKNQASFHRRIKQREQDLRHREQLVAP